MTQHKPKKKNLQEWVLLIALILASLYTTASVIIPRHQTYTSPYYTESVYRNLENVFNSSQYRLKNPTALIPDESVFSYAAGAYLRGIDPILINSEHTPLGKYFMAFFIWLMKNDKFVIIPSALLTLIALWLLGKKVLEDLVLAFVPVVIFSFEKLFIGQLTVVPLLDIIQLPFILLTFYAFFQERHRQRFWFTAFLIGLVAATKTVIPAILLGATFFLYFIYYRQFKELFRFILYLPLAGLVLILSYIQTFLDGYTFNEFIGFQKWILLYQKSKLIFPLSVWRLVFLNQWQAWWGDMRILRAEDWQITWPIFTSLNIILIMLVAFKKLKLTSEMLVLVIWILVYGSFLSLGVVASRFLLPFLPISFILGVYVLKIAYQRKLKI